MGAAGLVISRRRVASSARSRYVEWKCESERRCRACPSAVKCNILSENDFARTCSGPPDQLRFASNRRAACRASHSTMSSAVGATATFALLVAGLGARHA